jgi:LPS export ABC transporter permease LptG/LPS export ABC transporter permease LptF
MFRLIDRYLLREVIPYVLLGFVLLTAIIFAHQSKRFSELLVVYSRMGLPMEALGRIVTALIPGILVFTLPISLLIGILVGLGRLSGDSEIVALGASGVSRMQVLKPITALALAAVGLMMYLTFNVLPRAIHNLKDLKANQGVLFQGLKTDIKPRVFEEGIPHKVLYVEDMDRVSGMWRNIFVVDQGDGQSEPKIFTASSGSFREGATSEMPELHLWEGSVHQLIEPSDPDKAAQSRKHNQSQSYTVNAFQDTTIGVEVSKEKEAEALSIDQEQRPISELMWSDLLAFSPGEGEYRAWRAEIHERLALPAACLVFALLAVGFGISHVRTGRPFGLLLGLAITITYYLLALSGKHAAVSGKLPVWLGIWMANIVLGALAVLVLWAQRRPGSDPLSALSSLRHLWPRKTAGAAGNRREPETPSGADEPRLPEQSRGAVGPDWARLTRGPETERQRAGFLAWVRDSVNDLLKPLLIDRLVLSDLARFFFFIVGGFSALFMIITLFQLLDQITRNNIELSVVANYLLYLMPMILNYMAPLAALVAVMVTFGLLEKTSQVVVLKASGLSIYRLAAPALLASVVLSSFMFLNQDYVLPFTNRRQDNLYHLIKGGQQPAQTFYQTDHKWIFGIDSSIYNYAHFNPTENVFARFTMLSLSKKPFTIKSRLYARRASWDDATQTWLLRDGWERRFNGDQVQLESFKERTVSLPEHPEYFKRESRESSKMTLAELRQHIVDLSRAGFDVLDLRIDMYQKIAFPLTCLVMIIVGLPFAFSVGKRGALYGVTIGIAIGLAYWGLIELFAQMGRYELLPPLLAAWGPNMMFGAGGLYLFLTSRT